MSIQALRRAASMMFWTQLVVGIIPKASSFVGSDAETIPTLPKAKSFLVRGLADVEPAYKSFDGEMYAGLLPSTTTRRKEDGALFFWLLEPAEPSSTDTIVIWLNGGPGCSSFVGLLFENGPVTTPLNPAGSPPVAPLSVAASPPLIPNQNAWTKVTTMLHVEQPMGTGFSYGPEPESEEELSRDFYIFLQNFFDVFDHLRQKRLFVFGESYAGMYVPSIAHYIQRMYKNQASISSSISSPVKINLAGVGIGNGWIDAKIQGPAVIDYAWWHGMIDMNTKRSLEAMWELCIDTSARGQALLQRQSEPFHEFNVPDECGVLDAVLIAAGEGSLSSFPELARGPNMYDVTTWNSYHVLFSGNGTIARFFNDPTVREALHATHKEGLWTECVEGGGRERTRRRLLMLEQDKPSSTVPYIADLLDGGVRVLVYNGDRDLSCCVQGSEMSLNQMEWNGAQGWSEARRSVWTVGNHTKRVAGYSKAFGGLEFVVVYNSGHMVPTNQPEVALDLLARFLNEEQFGDVELPAFEAPETTGETVHQDVGQHSRSKMRRLRHHFKVFVTFILGFGCAILFNKYQNRGRDRISYQTLD